MQQRTKNKIDKLAATVISAEKALQAAMERLKDAVEDANPGSFARSEEKKREKEEYRRKAEKEERAFQSEAKGKIRELSMQHCPPGFDLYAIEENGVLEQELGDARKRLGDSFEFVAVPGHYETDYLNYGYRHDGNVGDSVEGFIGRDADSPRPVYVMKSTSRYGRNCIVFDPEGCMIFCRRREHTEGWCKCEHCDGAGWVKVGKNGVRRARP